MEHLLRKKIAVMGRSANVVGLLVMAVALSGQVQGRYSDGYHVRFISCYVRFHSAITMSLSGYAYYVVPLCLMNQILEELTEKMETVKLFESQLGLSPNYFSKIIYRALLHERTR